MDVQELTIVFKLAAPLLFFSCVLVIILYRRWREVFNHLFMEYSSTHHLSIQQVPVKRLEVPFSLSLRSTQKGDSLEISTTLPSPRSWGVHTLIHINIDVVMSKLLKPNQANDEYLEVVESCNGNRHTYTDCSGLKSSTIHLEERQVTPTDGPRSSYPMVIIATNHEQSLISLIHVKDKLLPTSYIIAQFLRDEDGLFYRLTGLYIPTNTDVDECSVCLTNTSSCVLLPCRHKCSCKPCTKRLAYCPICRATINTYFNTEQGIDIGEG